MAKTEQDLRMESEELSKKADTSLDGKLSKTELKSFMRAGWFPTLR